MADNSYGEKIIATEGLLAYYPLYVNGKESSGNYIDMVDVGSSDPVFTNLTLSPEGYGSFKSSEHVADYVSNESFLSVLPPDGILSMEAVTRFDHVSDVYRGILGYNMEGDSASVEFRLMLTYDGALKSMRLRVGFFAVVFDYDPNLFAVPKHVVMQYEADIGFTVVYIDGAEVTRLAGNGFTPSNDCTMMVGAFTYTDSPGMSYYGGSDSSDFAVYNRPLTRAEIWQRAKYGTYDGMILGSEGLLGYYPLDTQDDLSGLHNQGSSIVGAGQGDVNPVSGIAGAKIPVHKNFASDGGTASTIYLPIGTLAIELRAKVYVLKSEETYAVAFTLYDSFPAYTTNRIMVFSYPENDDLDYVSDGGGIIADLASYDEWHHYVIQNEDGAVDFYVDGVLLNSDGNSDLLKMLVLQLGCGTNPEGYYYGGETSNSNVAFYDRPLTRAEITARSNWVGSENPILNLLLSLSSITWSNRETKAQANPQPIYLANHGVGLQTPKYVVKNSPFHTDVMQNQQGDLRKYGYIASTTEISGSPVANKRVLLFEQDSCMLVDETVSDSAGNYRFDSLLIGKKYMITAQYGNKDEHTPPDYSATSVDWQSPTPYEG